TGSNGGGASGSGFFGSGGAFGSGSGGAGLPAGAFGSKKPSGFGRLTTRSRFQAASPASCRPGLRPTRGSGFCWALTVTSASADTPATQSPAIGVDLIADAP